MGGYDDSANWNAPMPAKTRKKRKGGRPRKADYVPFMFRMPEQMNYELVVLSMQSGYTRSELVRRAVGDYLGRLKADRAEGGPGKGYKVVE